MALVTSEVARWRSWSQNYLSQVPRWWRGGGLGHRILVTGAPVVARRRVTDDLGHKIWVTSCFMKEQSKAAIIDKVVLTMDMAQSPLFVAAAAAGAYVCAPAVGWGIHGLGHTVWGIVCRYYIYFTYITQ